MQNKYLPGSYQTNEFLAVQLRIGKSFQSLLGMKIGVDATSWQNNRGYGRHERALLRALLALDRENRYTFFMDSRGLMEQVPAEAEVRMIAARAGTATAASANGNRSPGDMWMTTRAMSDADVDVLLFPTIYTFVPTFTRAKKIVVIHDTIAETFPELTLPHWKSRLFWRAKVGLGRAQADVIVTVSEYSRRKIVERFRIPPEKLLVVGEAADPVFRRIPGAQLTPALEVAGIRPGERLVVYVGGFSPHKNLLALLEAFARVAKRFGDATLVMVGEYKKEVFHSYYGTIAARIEELGIRDRVVFTGYLADDDLAVLLNRSAVLVLPSLMEGFGLPAVEAAACGCPVAATTESPLPDLLAGGGIFFDPLGNGIEAALMEMLGSEEARRRMGDAAAHAAGRLTWDAAARQMLQVIRTCGRLNSR
jgi:glycosyltransferase involved in cell wall biosynthesis